MRFGRPPLAIFLLVLCPSVRPEDEVEDRKGRFVRVADPATIVVMRFNREYFFGLLGVQPAMSLDPSDSLEKEAVGALASLLKDRRLVLRLDQGHSGRSGVRSYDGYVYLEGGTCLNEVVLRRGYGRIDPLEKFSRLEEFKAIEAEARAEKRGIWTSRKEGSDPVTGTPCSDGAIPYAGTCGVSDPEILPESMVRPEYPRRARRKMIEGRVVLKAVVSKEGGVIEVTLRRSPDEQLTEAAIAAVEQWRYRPARKGGEPVDAYFTIVVDFYMARGPG